MVEHKRRVTAAAAHRAFPSLLFLLLGLLFTLGAAAQAADILVDPTGLTVSEPNGSAAFNVKLTTPPAAEVRVRLAPSNNECNASPTLVSLTGANWDTGVTVTVSAVDDQVIDGDRTCIIQTEPAKSGDPEYRGINPADVTVTVQDNELTAGIAVSPTALTVGEPNGSATFTVRADSEPVFSVTMVLSTSSNECSASPDTVTLTTGNWSAGVQVTVSAVDDARVDGNRSCVVQTGVTSSADPRYDGLNPADVTVTVQDDDQAGIRAGPIPLTVSEPNGSAAFTVTLTSEPLAGVTMSLSPTNGQCTVSPDALTLDSSNWSGGARATVTAVDDDLVDGDQACGVQFGPATSQDPQYQGRSLPNLAVTVRDDEKLRRILLPLVAQAWPPIPGTPVLQPISNSDYGGSFTVAWSAAPHATSYLLERATDGGFGDATVEYEGSALSFGVTDLGPTRYFFRVRGRNAYGDGPWSSAQSVEVLWEKEPNDTIGQANGPILTGLIYFGAFPVPTDINDYFYIELPAAGAVQVVLSNIPAGHNYDLALRYADSLVGYSGNLENAEEEIVAAGLPAGRYYIQVYHRSAGSSLQPYQLRVTY